MDIPIPGLTGKHRGGRDDQRRSLKRMKISATALLLSMVVLYLFARFMRETSSFFEIVMAFSEAAMVGALADWFAVVALFRHPLALPIPHTAIIPKNKDRLGENLAKFIRDNFLSQEAIGAKLNAVDVTGLVSRLFSDEQKARDLANKLIEYILFIAERFDQKDLRAFGKDLALQNVNSIQLGPWLGKVVETFTKNNRHHLLLDGGLTVITGWLAKNEAGIRARMKEGNPWWLPDFIDDKILDMIVGKFKELLEEIRNNPGHEVKKRIDEAIFKWVDGLKASPNVDERIHHVKERYLNPLGVKEALAGLSGDLKVGILQDLRNPDSTIRNQIEFGILTLGRSLGENPTVREKINFWLCSSLLKLSSEYADTISSIISDTVRKWDAERTSRTIELYVGKDLQWIRINGTLVGGLVGLLIYFISRFFH
ncbi:MAG TPA: DUF445 domain-containing protein [Thermodesulfobacteriota bacterium]|nr:DUF445 domain-containing protein [Thermodesulfobacteriota bacterium]